MLDSMCLDCGTAVSEQYIDCPGDGCLLMAVLVGSAANANISILL